MPKKRKPSRRVLAKGLERAAHNAEALAARLRELGHDREANAVGAAANAFSDAGCRLEALIAAAGH